MTAENSENNTIVFDDSFPLTRNILETRSPKSIKTLDKILGFINKGIAEEEIISTDFKDLKFYIGSIIGKIYKESIDENYMYAGKYQLLPEDLRDTSTPYELRSVKTYYKSLKKVSNESKEHPMFKEAIALTEELLPLVEVVEYLKEHMIKASEKKKQLAAAQKEENEEYIKKFTSHKDSQKVFNLLKDTADSIYKELYDGQLERLNLYVEKYQKSLNEGESDYKKVFGKNITALILMQKITKSEKIQYSERVYSLEKNYQELVEKEAKSYADDIVNHFIHKNTRKLAYILYNKDNLEDVQLNNINLGYGYIECDLVCQFEDKSQFLANTSIVLSYSKFGKPFYRYPTIFQHVKMPDGTYMSGPSEQKMDEEFAIARDETPKPKMKK